MALLLIVPMLLTNGRSWTSAGHLRVGRIGVTCGAGTLVVFTGEMPFFNGTIERPAIWPPGPTTKAIEWDFHLGDVAEGWSVVQTLAGSNQIIDRSIRVRVGPIFRFTSEGNGLASTWSLGIPLPTLILGAMLLPGLWLAGAIRTWARRHPPGHCRQCGYDLRGSKTACPECGRPIDDAAMPGSAKRSPVADTSPSATGR